MMRLRLYTTPIAHAYMLHIGLDNKMLMCKLEPPLEQLPPRICSLFCALALAHTLCPKNLLIHKHAVLVILHMEALEAP